MRTFTRLVEELESRPADADRVAALARWLRAAGRDAGALARAWLVVGGKPARPARVPLAALVAAAAAVAQRAGMAPWLFEAGLAAGDEPAEAIAQLLPWSAEPEPPPSLAQWLADWRAGAAADDGARAIVERVARLDDAIARRWAVRAAAGLVRPLASAWQWQRAWAEAFDEDAHDVAWRDWRGGCGGCGPGGERDAPPRERSFAPLAEPAHDAHAALLAAWHAAEAWAEPRWRGWRVQVVRRGDALAVWRRGGPLLNAWLPATWLVPSAWPEDSALEAVLVAWRDGRVVPVDQAVAATGARRRAASASLHLALTDWRGAATADLGAAQRRLRLRERWPEAGLGGAGGALPPVFTTPALPTPAGVGRALVEHAEDARAAGWSGLVLRHGEARWTLRPALRRVRAVLLYVPGEALGAAPSAVAALGLAACGFAVWNRAPRSEPEQAAAMAAARAGVAPEPPADAPGLPALRLLPLARLPLALPDHALQRLHAWLRANAGPRFGAQHAVEPALVFEVGFAAVRASRRHRLGAVLEDAAVLGWIEDAPPGSAGCADELRA